ncbi:CLC5A protein, partial [Bucorvus abyssinicus]|nr:CLC5A protein [Bucorvus abyssinicus]
MSENLIYADLNLTESTRPRLQNATDVQGSAYAEVKVRPLHTNSAAGYTTPGKTCCSRKLVAVLVAVIILLLISAVCLMLLYCRTAGSSLDGETSPLSYEEAPGCPQNWEESGGKCYFFSPKYDLIDWNTSRRACNDMGSDLVVIDSKEELDYLASRSRGHYYFLGLTYSKSENKWKWINNEEHRSDMFVITRHFGDYFCAVIGHGKVESASCNGSSTTKFMCEKAARISEQQKES